MKKTMLILAALIVSLVIVGCGDLVVKRNQRQTADMIAYRVVCIEGLKWIATPAAHSYETLAGPAGKCNVNQVHSLEVVANPSIE